MFLRELWLSRIILFFHHLCQKSNEAMGKKDELNFHDVVLLVKEKKPIALNLYLEMCDYLSIGVVKCHQQL